MAAFALSSIQFERRGSKCLYVCVNVFSFFATDKNDEAYNKYHEWRKTYVARLTWVKHACEICRYIIKKYLNMWNDLPSHFLG